MSGIPDIEVVPTSVTQARVLLQLKEPEKRGEAWKRVMVEAGTEVNYSEACPRDCGAGKWEPGYEIRRLRTGTRLPDGEYGFKH